jgi:hypothetical protein
MTIRIKIKIDTGGVSAVRAKNNGDGYILELTLVAQQISV